MMGERGWDAIVITGSDPHASEYPAERWKQVRWISGFAGEAGDIVITADHAGLWTDTRYFIAADQALEGTGIDLHKTRVPEQVLIPDWLASHFRGQGEVVVAVDGLCVSAGFVQEILDASDAAGIEMMVASVPNLLDPLWRGRPGIPQTPIFTVDHGETRARKLAWLRGKLDEGGLDGILLTALDDIAWTLNVRASDIAYNPFVISYLLVTHDETKWYVLKGDVEDQETGSTLDALHAEGVSICPYTDIELDLSQFEGRLQVDGDSLNYHLSRALSADVVMAPSPVQLRKAVKNAVEIEGMRSCHVLDGVAMEKFLYWLERSVEAQTCITEWDAAERLGRFRSDIEGYCGDSFETISAYGAGAALPHYVTPQEDAPVLYEGGLYLVDSGGQYLDGTTDITRTVPLGRCSRQEREDYTLVLKAHIDLAMAVFPHGTAGCQLDAVAREPLWRAKRNFGHGTGHGVGCFLGVHEGPADIRQNFNTQPLLPGMILSDEPGIYREGRHGVRHENLLLVVESESNEFGRWLEFEPLTLCHFDTSAIERNLLDQSEIDWLNEYNARVYKTLKGLLPPAVSAWLKEKTEAI